MNILIEITEKKVIGNLLKNKKIIAKESFELKNNLTENLLPMIDKLLKKNKLLIKDISKIQYKSEVEDSFTTNRIIKIAVEAMNWGLSTEKH